MITKSVVRRDPETDAASGLRGGEANHPLDLPLQPPLEGRYARLVTESAIALAVTTQVSR